MIPFLKHHSRQALWLIALNELRGLVVVLGWLSLHHWRLF